MAKAPDLFAEPPQITRPTFWRRSSPGPHREMTKPPLGGFAFSGADGARTRDLLAASQSLSQLSYGPRGVSVAPMVQRRSAGSVALPRCTRTLHP
jgi:hypothetical protein